MGEIPLVFGCEGEQLFGIAHEADCSIGVVIVVGGPQYRVGSHRQFVVLARAIAAQGFPVFRFDCRGMGDSTGKFPGFENLDSDIGAAIDAFQSTCTSVTRVVLWGLCDGATASAFYGATDDRVVGLCLANPWVHTEQGRSDTLVRHYYASRFIDPSFWRAMLSGRVGVLQSLRGFLGHARKSVSLQAGGADLPTRLFDSLGRFQRGVLLILSPLDLTASEFIDAAQKERTRAELLSANRVKTVRLVDADHTFSSQAWMSQVIQSTLDWLKSVAAPDPRAG